MPLDPNQQMLPPENQGMPEGMPIDPMQVPPQEGMGDDQPVSEEQKQALIELINQLRQKIGSFNAMDFASKNKIEQMRSDILQQVFEKLQLAGVDLSSTESVREFIDKLRQDSPELAEMFEQAMDALLGGEQSGMSTSPQDPTASMDLSMAPEDLSMMPQNNMNNQNQDETLSQEVPEYNESTGG